MGRPAPAAALLWGRLGPGRGPGRRAAGRFWSAPALAFRGEPASPARSSRARRRVGARPPLGGSSPRTRIWPRLAARPSPARRRVAECRPPRRRPSSRRVLAVSAPARTARRDALREERLDCACSAARATFGRRNGARPRAPPGRQPGDASAGIRAPDAKQEWRSARGAARNEAVPPRGGNVGVRTAKQHVGNGHGRGRARSLRGTNFGFGRPLCLTAMLKKPRKGGFP